MFVFVRGLVFILWILVANLWTSKLRNHFYYCFNCGQLRNLIVLRFVFKTCQLSFGTETGMLFWFQFYAHSLLHHGSLLRAKVWFFSPRHRGCHNYVKTPSFHMDHFHLRFKGWISAGPLVGTYDTSIYLGYPGIHSIFLNWMLYSCCTDDIYI